MREKLRKRCAHACAAVMSALIGYGVLALLIGVVNLWGYGVWRAWHDWGVLPAVLTASLSILLLLGTALTVCVYKRLVLGYDRGSE